MIYVDTKKNINTGVKYSYHLAYRSPNSNFEIYGFGMLLNPMTIE